MSSYDPSFKPSYHLRKTSSERGLEDVPSDIVLFGWHPVLEALGNPKRVCHRLFATDNALRRLENHFSPLPDVPITSVRPHEIDRMIGVDATHQGLLLECAPLRSPRLDTLEPEGLVVVLDQITDPHNVGAILRTAAAYSVRFVVTTARHSPAATGVLAKAASGGLEHVPISLVRNLGDALVTLGERGFMRVGLDSTGDTLLDGGVTLRKPLALVLGAEGKGLRQRTRDCCDVIARLETPGSIKSLNVSNAAAIALHLASKV